MSKKTATKKKSATKSKARVVKASGPGPTERKLIAMSAHLHSQEAQIREQGATIARLVAAIETANANTGAFVRRAETSLSVIEQKVRQMSDDNAQVKTRLGGIFGNGG